MGKLKLLEKATASHRAMARKKRKGTAKQKQDPKKKSKASRSPQGKQREDRREGWETKRRQPQAPKVLMCKGDQPYKS
ncbi:hypothetical protein HaLaN_15884 [Haematococcus lacustris]|uniref:Uncharacterized protein n=1 Tax=Haematococcus lacustris TaxID=44745 RepID=A0A699ZHQ4_HAELA|nr:hypothetical protein HaLaN_15884 [Haematococcus lacustris]